jgi:hypothetical protein
MEAKAKNCFSEKEEKIEYQNGKIKKKVTTIKTYQNVYSERCLIKIETETEIYSNGQLINKNVSTKNFPISDYPSFVKNFQVRCEPSSPEDYSGRYYGRPKLSFVSQYRPPFLTPYPVGYLVVARDPRRFAI